MKLSPAGRAESWAALVCAVLALVLMMVRLDSVISFAAPLQLATSGYEQESLLAIWERLHGHAVYVSRWAEPFRWAIYNWLYYGTYAAFADTAMGLLSLADAWLPTVTRVLTVIGMVAAIAGARAAIGAMLHGRDVPPALAWAAATVVGAGPLIGYWGMTTRPDIWALAFELFAIVAFWRCFPGRPLRAVALFCVLAYVAWAFKQSNVAAIGAVGLFLLLRRQWPALMLLVTVMIAAWAVTLAVGPAIYRTSVLLGEYQSINTVANALRIFASIVPKLLPVAAGVAALIFLLAFGRVAWRSLWDDDAILFSTAGLCGGVLLAFAASRQPGAAENYYFTTAFFGMALVIAMSRLTGQVKSSGGRIIQGAAALGWLLQAGALAAVLAGFVGTTSLRHFDDYHRAAKACLDKLPRPLFVDNHYLSLPWMTPDNPSYVLAFGYLEDRIAGRKNYQGDGIGGRISRGEFAALAFTNDPGGAYDGATLTRYRRVASDCPDLFVFLRETNP